jgi:hypothetical protein
MDVTYFRVTLPSTSSNEKWCRLFNFNKLLSSFYFLCSFIINLLFKLTGNNKCRCRWCSVPSKVPQSLFKSYHNSSMLRCFKKNLLYVFTFLRTLTTFKKCKRRSWCKWFNTFCSDCSINFLSNPLQFSFLYFFLFFFSSQLCLLLVWSFFQQVYGTHCLILMQQII